MIAYRIQDKARDLGDLLDPEQQYSFPMDGEDDEMVRHGVSGCESLPELAAYLATHAIVAEEPVLVVVEGPESEDVPCDADEGEVLVLPEHVAVVADDEGFFDVVSDLVDMAWESGAGYRSLLDVAEERM